MDYEGGEEVIRVVIIKESIELDDFINLHWLIERTSNRISRVDQVTWVDRVERVTENPELTELHGLITMSGLIKETNN